MKLFSVINIVLLQVSCFVHKLPYSEAVKDQHEEEFHTAIRTSGELHRHYRNVQVFPSVSHVTDPDKEVQSVETDYNYTLTGFESNGRNSTWKNKHSSLYSTGVLRNLPLYCTPVVMICGIIGNTISFIVLQKFTRVHRFSSDFHLCTLAVFDTGGLLFSTFPFWANTFLRADLAARGFHNPFRTWFSYGPCAVWMYASFEFRYLSHWTIVIFSLERYFIITQPFESVTRFTIKRSAIITATLVLVTGLMNIHIFWMFKEGVTPDGHTYCAWRPAFYIATSVHMVLMGFIPSLIIVVFNCLMIRNLAKHRKEDPRVVGSTGKEREMQVTRRLIAVSVTFVALSFPFFAVAYYRNIQILLGQADFSVVVAEFYSFFCFFYMTNYACNFILYCVTGTRFRKAVIRLFRCEPIDADMTSSTSQRRSSTASCTPNLSRHSSTIELRKDIIETVPLNVVLTRLKMKSPVAVELYA